MLTFQPNPLTDPPARSILTIFLIAPIIVTIVAMAISLETADWLLSEAGPIEQQSPVLWIILAVFGFGLFGVRNLSSWAVAVLSLAAAGREASLHVYFGDYSMLKFPFYYREPIALEIRALCAGIVLLIGFSAALLVFRTWKRLRQHSLRHLPSWAWIMVMTIAALVISKVFDRSQAILEDTFSFDMHQRLALAIQAVEETTELLLPLAFAAAMLCLVINDQHRRLMAHTKPNSEE